jgi:hypothetical protein
MLKKMMRLVFMFELVFKIVHRSSGKRILFDVDYTFKYRWGGIRQGIF